MPTYPQGPQQGVFFSSIHHLIFNKTSTQRRSISEKSCPWVFRSRHIINTLSRLQWHFAPPSPVRQARSQTLPSTKTSAASLTKRSSSTPHQTRRPISPAAGASRLPHTAAHSHQAAVLHVIASKLLHSTSLWETDVGIAATPCGIMHGAQQHRSSGRRLAPPDPAHGVGHSHKSLTVSTNVTRLRRLRRCADYGALGFLCPCL